MNCYYYLHTNGDLIHKPSFVLDSCPEYFNSPFVRRVWNIDTSNRSDAWTLAIEALRDGARVDRVKELAQKWGLTREDLPEFLILNPKPSQVWIDGMDKFIREILGLDPNTVWDEISQMDGGKA